MFLKIFLKYILGYVKIKVEGMFIERFINICISKKIFLWNIKRERATILYANIGINDYKKIREVARKTKSKVDIQSKRGIPFLLHRYRKRKIFLGFLIITIVGLSIMSKFIWNIEVSGNVEIPKEEILTSLSENGLSIGKTKNKIKISEIINKIRLSRNDIAWIGIRFKGTNAIVEIKEISKAPKIIKEDEYCNIISNKTGMITKINVQNGTAKVKSGDIVKKGDLLVNGYLEGLYTGIRYVHATADIEAKIWYSKKEKAYYNQQVKVSTGKSEKKYAVKINNFKINFYKTLSNFKNYDTINESKKIMLFSNFYLPLEICKNTNNEYTMQEVEYTREELIENTTKKIEQEIEATIENKNGIINKQVNTYEKEGYIEIEVVYEVLENIGVEDKIIF